ncbi:MAG: DNA polymerase III subunit beta [Christensenellaceae bacterium]|jgi:DNA polymerase-3 subunit beta|nr:DNA polymerase III subunit beta [Christensenellaceae bacterium]
MHFICQRDELLSALNAALRAIPSRSPMQILENLYIRADSDGLSLTGSDLNFGVEARFSGTIETEGEILLPGRLFGEIVRKLPAGEVSLQVNDRFTAVIRVNGSRTTLQGLSAQEYPRLPEIENAHNIELSAEAFRDMVQQTSFAVAQDDSRPILTGCLLEIDGETINMVALDGFRLALKTCDLLSASEAFSCVIPGRSLQEIARLIGDGDESLTLQFSPSHAFMALGALRAAIRLLDGEFVKYRQLIPSESQTTMRVNRDALSDCVERAFLMAREGRNNLLKFSISEENLTISSNSELGDVFEQLPIISQGNPLEISFNARYISDAIKALSVEEVLFKCNTSISPCVLTPVEGEDFTFLVLPVRTYQGA